MKERCRARYSNWIQISFDHEDIVYTCKRPPTYGFYDFAVQCYSSRSEDIFIDDKCEVFAAGPSQHRLYHNVWYTKDEDFWDRLLEDPEIAILELVI